MTHRGVSAVMPAYNAGRFIGAAIESVLGQTYACQEIIVVDDGSTDDTAAIVQGFKDKVTYLHQANARQAAARNTGIRRSRADVVAFIDADDVWKPDKIEKQMRLLENSPGLGLVYCSIQEMAADGATGLTRRAQLRGYVSDRLLLGETEGGISGSTALVPRSVLDAIGGFDEDLTPVEDTDLFWRVSLSYPIDFVDEPLVLGRQHGSNAHNQMDRMDHAWRAFHRKALQHPDSRRRGWLFRARCRGRLFYMLAGDHARLGRRASALRYAVRALLAWPPVFVRLARAVGRKLLRSTAGPAGSGS